MLVSFMIIWVQLYYYRVFLYPFFLSFMILITTRVLSRMVLAASKSKDEPRLLICFILFSGTNDVIDNIPQYNRVNFMWTAFLSSTLV